MINVLVTSDNYETKGKTQIILEYFLRKFYPIMWKHENGPENMIEIKSGTLEGNSYNIDSPGLERFSEDLFRDWKWKRIPKRIILDKL